MQAKLRRRLIFFLKKTNYKALSSCWRQHLNVLSEIRKRQSATFCCPFYFIVAVTLKQIKICDFNVFSCLIGDF